MTVQDEHERMRQLISRAADDAVDERERRTIDEHVATCEACRSFADDVRAIGDALGRSSQTDALADRVLARVNHRPVALPEPRGPRLRRWAIGLAAAAAVVVALVWLADRNSRSTERSEWSPPIAEVIGAHWRGHRVAATRGGTATVRLADGSRLELSENCELDFARPASGERHAIDVVRGTVTAHVAPADGRFVVRTPAGSAEAVGTSFTVGLDVLMDDLSDEEKKTMTRRMTIGSAMTVAVLTGVVLVRSVLGNETLHAGETRAITTWSVAGRVVDEAGNPVAGARVWVDNATPFQTVVMSDGTGVPSIPWRTFSGEAAFADTFAIGPSTFGPAVTGADGRFRVRNVGSPMRGHILVLHPEFAERKHPIDRTQSAVRGDGDLDVGDVPIARGRHVNGRVVDPAGNAVAGASVAVAIPRDGTGYSDYKGALRMTKTDAEGRFSLRGLADGHTLVVGAWDATSVPTERRFSTERDVDGLVLRLVEGATMRVVVHDGRNGLPVAGALVRVADPGLKGGFSVRPIQSAATGADGGVTLRGLARGTYRVNVVPPDRKGHIGVESTPAWSVTRECATGVRTTIEVDGARSVTIGVVDAESGQPVADVRLDVRPDRAVFDQAYAKRFGWPASEIHVPEAKSTDGRFALESLRPGRWIIRGYADGYQPIEERVDVSEALEPTEVRLRMSVAERTLSGTVVDAETGLPIAGALVDCYEWSPWAYGINRRKTETDAAGAFRATRIVGDTGVVLKVLVSKPGYLRSETVFKRGQPRPTDTGPIRLARECTIRGRILDAAGQPLDRVRLLTSRSKDALDALTDRDGRFEFRGLRVGRYTIWRDATKVGVADFQRPGEVIELKPVRAP